MLVDVFYKNETDEVTRTVWLGVIEVEDSAIETLQDDEKKVLIESAIASAISNNIEWTPVSEIVDGQKNIEVEFKHGNKLN